MNRRTFGYLRKGGIEPNREPLHERAPTHDANGRRLSDFMMLLPGLRDRPRQEFETRLGLLEGILGAHADVVFADLNAPRNLLWVSVRARPGVINDLAAAIRLRLPEAKLVGHPCSDATTGQELATAGQRKRSAWRLRLPWRKRDGN